MKIERLPLDTLSSFEDNPREIDADGLARLTASIERFGFYAPLVVWTGPDGNDRVIAGNQRLRALRDAHASGKLADDRVPCVRFDGSEERARLIVLRDNIHDGDWEWGALSDYLSDLVETGGMQPDDLALTGFDSEALAELIEISDSALVDATDPEDFDFEDEAPPPTRSASTREDVESETADSARLSIGNIRGKVSAELYSRFLAAFDARAATLGTTDIGPVLSSLLDDFERASE